MNARFALVACFVVAQVPAFAALDAYILIKGSKQGEFKGSNPDKTSKVSEFTIKGFSQSEVENGKSHSAGGGGGAGKVRFNEFTIKKVTDSASPLLFRACASGEHLEVTLTFYKTSDGKRTQQSQAHFINAIVAKVSHVQVSGKPMEELTFNFEKITWTWNNGGKTYNDDWTIQTGHNALTR